MVALDRERLAAATLPLVAAPLLTLGALIVAGSVTGLWVPSTAGLVLFLGSSIALLFLSNPMSAASQGRLVSSRPTENSVSVEGGMMPTRLEYRRHYSRGGLLALYAVGCFVVGGGWLLLGVSLCTRSAGHEHWCVPSVFALLRRPVTTPEPSGSIGSRGRSSSGRPGRSRAPSYRC